MAEETTRAVLAAEILACHDRLRRHIDALVSSDGAGADAETVHRLRTNARRCRAALRAGRKVWGRRRTTELERGLRELARRLAPVRELDVLLLAGTESVNDGTLDGHVWARVAPLVTHDRHGAAAGAARFAARAAPVCLDGIRALVDEVPKHPKRARAPARAALEHRLARATRRADRRRPESLTHAPAEALHAYRLATKRVRDTMRAFRSVLSARERQELTTLKTALDRLGAVQDATSGRTLIAAWVAADRLDAEAGDAVAAVLRKRAAQARSAPA